jgi:hypothetical protein
LTFELFQTGFHENLIFAKKIFTMATLNAQANANIAQFGQNGFKLLSGTDTSTERFYAIQALEDAIISATVETGDPLSATTLTAGTVVYGPFTGITMTSGSVIAYLMP